MTKRQSQFFKGAAIAAQYALPNLSPQLLHDEATLLATLSEKHATHIGEVSSSDQATSLACAWLDERYRKSPKSVELDRLLDSIHLYDAQHPSVQAAQIAGTQASKLFEDESLGSLLSGTQASLSVLSPESAQLFADDLQSIRQVLPSAEALYLKNRVPRQIIPDLLVHEYAFFRLKNPGAKLAQFGGGFGPGTILGLIDLKTTPFPADVFVDNKPMGVKSPTVLIAVPGSREVKATQQRLKGGKNVRVNAGSTVPVSLRLV